MSIFYLLNAAGRAAPLSMLRIGPMEERLESAGLRSLGDVLKYDALYPPGILSIPGLDRSERRQLAQRLVKLAGHINEDGDIDWGGYHQGLEGIFNVEQKEAQLERSSGPRRAYPSASGDDSPMTPSAEVTDGNSFISALPEVIQCIVESRIRASDRAILLERIARQPQDRKTLDEIASSVQPRITREAVRLRESKLLCHIEQALLHGRQRRLGVRFQASFTKYWQLVAEQFDENQEITFTRFIETLESTWGVSYQQFFEHLPFITAVLTSKAVPPRQWRAHMRKDARVYRPLSPEDAAKPVTMLAVGKAADDLLDSGIETVGELFDAARTGHVLDGNTSAGKAVEKVISALSSACGDDGAIDWSLYEATLGLVRLPSEPKSPAEFLANLATDLAAVIEGNRYSLRALQVFETRIAVPKALRPTLADAASRLGTYGPSVKREESLLLSGLNDQLVRRDLTRSVVTFHESYLAFWSAADRCYQDAAGDFGAFCSLISSTWTLSPTQLAESREILWAVLDGYPRGRPPRKLNRKRGHGSSSATSERDLVGVVVLRGFRRVH